MGNFSALKNLCSLSFFFSLSLSLASSSLGEDTVDGPVAASAVHSKKQFYEELVFSWITAHPATRAVVYANAWFFFDLLVRGRGRGREKERKREILHVHVHVRCR